MKRRGLAGYTILEVMIVLAVTGSLFFSAALLLGGRQAQTEFTQSVRDYESKLQSVASEVSSGYYPSVSCLAPASGRVVIPSGASGSGASTGCVFLGKVLNLHADNTEIITVLGRQFSSRTIDVKTLAEALPVKVANATVDVTETYTHKYNMRPIRILPLSGAGAFQAIAFIHQLAGGAAMYASSDTGSRSVLLYAITGDAANNTSTSQSITIDETSLIRQANGVRICLEGGNGKRAEITVGARGTETATDVLLDTGVSSECRA